MSFGEQIPFHQNPQYWNAQGWGFGGIGGQGGQYGQGQGYGSGLGQAAFGQQGFGGQHGFGGLGGWQQGQSWGAPWQRQLSQHETGEIVRQLIPVLSQIVGQAQQPQAAYGFGYGNQGQGGWGGFGGGGFGQGQRQLSQQDVNEVVRQILPVIPQIVSLLQGQQQGPLASAIYGGYGGLGWGQHSHGGQGGFGQNPLGQAAFGNVSQYGNVGGWGGQRQLNQVEVGEIVRQLTAALPQVIANLQAFNQQQQQQQRAA